MLCAGTGQYLHAGKTPEFDQFGGWKGKTFKATGFFRTEQEKRWWLVTPKGHAFMSFGINHFHPDWWRQNYNRQAWKKRLNLSRLDGPEFTSSLRHWFLKTCREYGFNTVGVHNSLSIVNTPQPVLPYMLPIPFVDIPHWKHDIKDSNFTDVFAKEFVSHCDQLAKEKVLPVRDDPFLLGYAMTDCPLFTAEDCRERPDAIGGARRKARIGWPRRLRSLGDEAPGKQAYVQTMQEIYRNEINDFNSTYGTRFESFDALAKAKNWRPHIDLSNGNEIRDNTEFLKHVVSRYYTTTRDAIRKYDKNHLFVGDKINANTNSLDTVLPVTSRFTDIVFYQMYGRYQVQKPGLDRWSRISNKPLLNGDSGFSMITDHMPRPYGPVADSLEQRADWTREFFENAFARPDFIGWHYCGLIDAPNLIPRKKSRQHSGLLDGYGHPYPELKNAIKRCTDQLFENTCNS
jgi:hypothetical protein